MENAKRLLTSRTIWGIIISVLGKISAGYFGVDVFAESSEKLITGIEKIGMQSDLIYSGISLVVSGLGDVIATYGRVKATKVIGKPDA